MRTHSSIAAAERESREREPWRFYGRSLWRAKVGDEVIELATGRRGEVISLTLDVDAITVRLRTGVTAPFSANGFRHVNQTTDSAYGRRKGR